MVGKLLKYDLKAYFRVLVPAYLVLFTVALINRIVQIFEPAPMAELTVAGQTYEVIFISLSVLLGLACVVTLVIAFAQIIIVFYRNLFTREGYLSFTLPVSTNQHLWAKILGALIVDAVSILAVILALVIATMGEVLAEVWKAAWYLLAKVFVPEFGVGNAVSWGLELLVLLVVSAIAGYLFYYLCITIGQQAKKNRVLAAFGVFFAFYVVGQILMTVFMIIVSINDIWLESILESIFSMGASGVHLVLIVSIVVSSVVALVEYFINRNLIDRHLNLE